MEGSSHHGTEGPKASSRPHTESAAQEDTGDPLNWGPASRGRTKRMRQHLPVGGGLQLDPHLESVHTLDRLTG